MSFNTNKREHLTALLWFPHQSVSGLECSGTVSELP